MAVAALVRVEICSPDEYWQSHPGFGTVGMVGIWVLLRFEFPTGLGSHGFGFLKVWVLHSKLGFCRGDAEVLNGT